MKRTILFAVVNLAILAALPLTVYLSHSSIQMSSYSKGDFDVFLHTSSRFVYLGHSTWSGWKYSSTEEGPPPPLLHMTRQEFADKILHGSRMMTTSGEFIRDDDVTYMNIVEYADKSR